MLKLELLGQALKHAAVWSAVSRAPALLRGSIEHRNLSEVEDTGMTGLGVRELWAVRVKGASAKARQRENSYLKQL